MTINNDETGTYSDDYWIIHEDGQHPNTDAAKRSCDICHSPTAGNDEEEEGEEDYSGY